jgi:hypothetical protein
MLQSDQKNQDLPVIRELKAAERIQLSFLLSFPSNVAEYLFITVD